MATLAEQASKLLDFDQKLDITLLDSIVGCMYSGAGEQVSLVSSQDDSRIFYYNLFCIHLQSLFVIHTSMLIFSYKLKMKFKCF